MEKAPQSSFYHCLSLTEPIAFLFYNTMFIWITILSKFSARFLSLLPPCPCEKERHACATSISHHAEKINPPSDRGVDDLSLLGDDVEIILDEMGIRRELDGERFEERLRFDELSNMFEEKEPSLEEVKQAFSVFDENGDGFIDAVELMRVLSKLGFKDGVKLDECERMIASYDENKDDAVPVLARELSPRAEESGLRRAWPEHRDRRLSCDHCHRSDRSAAVPEDGFFQQRERSKWCEAAFASYAALYWTGEG